MGALHHLLATPADAAGVLTDGSDPEAGPPGQVVTATRFAAALPALLPREPQELPVAVVADALLAAFHPSVTLAVGLGQRAAATAAWAPSRVKLGSAVPRAIEAHAAELAALLLGERGADSDDAALRDAGCGALGGAMGEALERLDGSTVLPGRLYEQLLPRLREQLGRLEHDALTREQLRVYFTPPGQLSWEAGGAGGFVPDVGGGKLAPVSRAAAPSALRPAKAQRANGSAPSRGGPKPKDAKEAARLDQLAREADIRARVQALHDRLERGLHALAGVASGNPDFTQHVRLGAGRGGRKKGDSRAVCFGEEGGMWRVAGKLSHLHPTRTRRS